MSVSDARKRAVKNYREKNKEKTNRDTKRRSAKSYIRYATDEELEELLMWIEDKKNNKKI